jgi:hypothetical protein
MLSNFYWWVSSTENDIGAYVNRNINSGKLCKTYFLTIVLTAQFNSHNINDPMKAAQNPSTVKPLTMVLDNRKIPALMTRVNKPSVRIVTGKVRIINNGRRTALNKPSTSANISAVQNPAT